MEGNMKTAKFVAKNMKGRMFAVPPVIMEYLGAKIGDIVRVLLRHAESGEIEPVEFVAKITKERRITVPINVVNLLGIEAGDLISVEIVANPDVSTVKDVFLGKEKEKEAKNE
jgi:hypothetical protein